MPSVADVWLTMRTDKRKVAQDIEEGAKAADTAGAGKIAGDKYSRSFSTSVRKNLIANRGSLGAFLRTVSGFGDIFDAASKDASMFARSVAAVGAVTGIGEPAVAALAVSTTALAGAFVSAGAGAGAYALALYPALQSTGVAMKATALHTAQVAKIQSNYNIALAAGVKPAAAAAARTRALAASNAQLAASMKGIPPQVRQFAVAVTAAKNEYLAWGKSLAVPVLAPLTTALGNVHPILKATTPLVKAFSGALGVLVTELSSNIQAGGFQRVVNTLLPYVVPNVLNLAHALGNVAAGLWDVIKAFLPFSTKVTGGLASLTARFKEWASTLGEHSGFKALIDLWQKSWPTLRTALLSFLGILKNIVAAWATMVTPASSGVMWDIANPLLAVADKLSAHPELVQALTYMYLISRGAKELGGAFGGLKALAGSGSKLLSLVSGGKISTGVQGAGDTMLLASRNMQAAADTMLTATGAKAEAGAAGAAGGAKAAGAGGLAGLIGPLMPAIAAIVAAWLAKQEIFNLLGPSKTKRFEALPRENTGQTASSLAIAADPALAARVGQTLASAWSVAYENFQRQFAGKITATFAGADKWLIKAGLDIMAGLSSGIVTGYRAVTGFFTGLQAKVQQDVPGALGWLRQHGVDIIAGLWAGISARWAAVAAWFAGSPARIQGWWNASGGWLIAHGRNLMSGFWAGVSARWQGIAAWFAGSPGRVQGYFAGTIGWLVSHGRELMSGFWAGISARWAGVAGWLSGMPYRVGSYFLGCLGWLANAGRNVIQGLWNGMTSIWSKVTGWISGLAGWIKAHKGPLALDQQLLRPAGAAIMQGLKVGLLGGMMPIKSMLGVFTGDIGSLLGSLPGLVSKLGGALGIGGGSVGKWAGVAALALRLAGAPANLLPQVLRQIGTESGGNPLAVNLTDINAQMGDPSKGLLQVIGATFRAFAGPLISRGVFDPLANIYAAIKYAQAVYGPTLMSGGSGLGSGHGYALGTTGAAPGWGWVGERGRELVRFWGGETVLPHGESMRRAGYAGGTGTAPVDTGLEGRLDAIAGLLATIPAATAAALAGSLSGQGRLDSHRAYYGVTG